MNKKLCWFLDIIYFVTTFFVMYSIYQMGVGYNSLGVYNVGKEMEVWEDIFPLLFQARDLVIVPFIFLLTSILDFSFISKILTHFKYGKRTQLVVFIILCVAVVIFGIAAYNSKSFVPMIW